MIKVFAAFFVLFLFLNVFISCSKQSEQLPIAAINEYYPLEVGKVSFYRLDSNVLINFNSSFIVHSYHVKDSVESTFTDNQGRVSYRIFRFITDTAEAGPWLFDDTFVATPTNETLEYVDNNLRFIKLHSVMSNGYRWKAHSFINTGEEATRYLDEWEYEYSNTGGPFTDTVLMKTYNNTLTVAQIDEYSPYGPFDRTLDFQERKYGIEVYSKGSGLVYKDLVHWTWQGQSTNFEDNGFGVTLRLLRHN